MDSNANLYWHTLYVLQSLLSIACICSCKIYWNRAVHNVLVIAYVNQSHLNIRYQLLEYIERVNDLMRNIHCTHN